MDESRVFLSTLPAGSNARRPALFVVLISTIIFLLAIPFAKTPLPRVDAFIPIYESALVVNDLITAVLLFGQFKILRLRAFLVLASGYLFTAFLAIAHALTFPGLFSATGLLGAGPQSTAWLYMLWHSGFPLFVIAYTWLKQRDQLDKNSRNTGVAVVGSIGAVFLLAGGLVMLTTAGHNSLPSIMAGNRYTAAMIIVVTSVWIFSFLALAALWRQRPHSVLDTWLMVVMCVWIFDIALSAVFNGGRFDLGFYAGRIYGLLAASFVLCVLLLENGVLYARLVEAFHAEHQKATELMAVNKELDAFTHSVSHDLRAPVRAVNGYIHMLEEDYAEKLDDEGKRRLTVVRESAQRMDQLIVDLLAFARMGRQPLRTRHVELDALMAQIIAELSLSNDIRKINFNVGKLGAVDADPTLLKQALVNLLSNAVKFSRDRSPAEIEIGRQEVVEAGESRAVYYVKDNGAGFDMRQYHKLFGVFQRLHSAEEFEGTGVGLAIVQKVVTRHGGRVWAASVPGQGATFFFTLGADSASNADSVTSATS